MSKSQSIITAWASLFNAIMLLLVLRHPTCASCVAWMCCRMSNSIKHVWAYLDLSFHRHWLYIFLHSLRSSFSPSRPLQLCFEAHCETSLARDIPAMQSTPKSRRGRYSFICLSVFVVLDDKREKLKIEVLLKTPSFWPISDRNETRVRFHGEQVKTSKAGDRATGENGDTCRTRVRPISATPEREAGDIAACSHVLPPDAQCHWSISQAQSRQRCEKRLKRLRRCFFLSGW